MFLMLECTNVIQNFTKFALPRANCTVFSLYHRLCNCLIDCLTKVNITALDAYSQVFCFLQQMSECSPAIFWKWRRLSVLRTSDKVSTTSQEHSGFHEDSVDVNNTPWKVCMLIICEVIVYLPYNTDNLRASPSFSPEGYTLLHHSLRDYHVFIFLWFMFSSLKSYLMLAYTLSMSISCYNTRFIDS